MKDFQIRVIARACITRYNNGETDIEAVVGSYNNLTEEDAIRVKEYVYSERKDIVRVQ